MADSLPFRVTTTVFHVLLALSGGSIHAYGIMKAVEEGTDGRFRIAPGSLHFTLGKLLDAELIEEVADPPDADSDDARRKYFRLTAKGRTVLSDEATAMAKLVEMAREQRLVRDGTGN